MIFFGYDPGGNDAHGVADENGHSPRMRQFKRVCVQCPVKLALGEPFQVIDEEPGVMKAPHQCGCREDGYHLVQASTVPTLSRATKWNRGK